MPLLLPTNYRGCERQHIFMMGIFKPRHLEKAAPLTAGISFEQALLTPIHLQGMPT